MWVLILIVAIVVISVVWAIASPFVEKGKERKLQASFTECTVGILRETGRTGRYINEQPQLSVTFDAVLQDGATTPVVVTEIVSLTDLHKLREGAVYPICYDPQSGHGRLDRGADEEALQDLFDRYLARRNPRGFTYEQRVALRTRGVRRRALLTDLKLTGEEEDGCREVKITARIDEKGGGERILERTSWMTDAEIEALTVGKLVTLQIVEDDPPWFSVLQLTDRAFSGE